ncbi:MAG: SPOR domain-containing protein [Candidatus Zixiibacteriota bacterium]|nr:MAG: SPOR domain-containing protein [candidate division Zixibacteria bacterium]
MKKVIAPFLLVIFGAFVIIGNFGCSKDKDEIAELEQEVLEEQSADYLPDTVSAEAPAEQAGTESTEEYTMTPEVVPEEEEQVPTPPRPSGEGYTVQVAAGTNPTYAHDLADRFIMRGYEAFVTEAVIDGQTFYRIRIGDFETVTEAKNFGAELRDKYSTDFWIDNNI